MAIEFCRHHGKTATSACNRLPNMVAWMRGWKQRNGIFIVQFKASHCTSSLVLVAILLASVILHNCFIANCYLCFPDAPATNNNDEIKQHRTLRTARQSFMTKQHYSKQEHQTMQSTRPTKKRCWILGPTSVIFFGSGIVLCCTVKVLPTNTFLQSMDIHTEHLGHTCDYSNVNQGCMRGPFGDVLVMVDYIILTYPAAGLFGVLWA